MKSSQERSLDSALSSEDFSLLQTLRECGNIQDAANEMKIPLDVLRQRIYALTGIPAIQFLNGVHQYTGITQVKRYCRGSEQKGCAKTGRISKGMRLKHRGDYSYP